MPLSLLNFLTLVTDPLVRRLKSSGIDPHRLTSKELNHPYIHSKGNTVDLSIAFSYLAVSQSIDPNSVRSSLS